MHIVGGGGDAVSFLAGILKPSTEEKSKTIEIKKVSTKKTTSDSGLDDPTRKHICNVCSKKFQKRSNLIDHLRLHANVKVFSCEVRIFMEKWADYDSSLRSIVKNRLFKLGTTKLTSEHIPRRNRKILLWTLITWKLNLRIYFADTLVTSATRLTASQAL